jgi:hypothetical protein
VGRWEIALPDGRYNFQISGGNIATYTIYNHAIFDSTITYPSPALGTVTSVAQTVPAEMTITGSPITGTGTLALDWATEVKNKIFAGPTTGADAKPTFRVAVLADLPSFGPTATTTFGSATKASVVTTNAQGIITTISESTVTPAWASVSSTPTTLGGYGVTDGIKVIWSSTSAVTIGNTTTATSIFAAATGSLVIAGNTLVEGSIIRIRAHGFYTQTTAGQTLRIILTTAGGKVLCDTTALSIANLNTTASSPFSLEIIVVCQAGGVPTTATFYPQIILHASGAVLGAAVDGYIWPQPGFTATTANMGTTGSNTLACTLQWGTAAAASTITFTDLQVTIER